MLKNLSAAAEVEKLPEPEWNRKEGERSTFLSAPGPQRCSLSSPIDGTYKAADGGMVTEFADCSETGRPWIGCKSSSTHGK